MAEFQNIMSRSDLESSLTTFMRESGGDYRLDQIGFFGSFARDEARAESDVDIVIRFAPDARPTLYDLALIREELAERLGRDVDVLEYRDSMAQALRDRIRKEAVYI